MFKFVIISFLFLIQFVAHSNSIDSLWNAYHKQQESSDTALPRTIHHLSNSLRYSLPDTAVYLAKEGVKFAQKSKDKELEAFLNEVMGDAYWQLTRFKSSIKHYERARDLFMEIGNRKNAGAMHADIGYLYMDMVEYEKALKHYQTAINIANEEDYPELKVLAQTYMAQVLQSMEQYEKAMKTYRETLVYYTKIKYNQRNIGLSLNNIGNIHNGMGDPDSAIYYYKQGIKELEAVGDDKNVGLTYMNIGNIYYNDSNYTEAEKYFTEGLILIEKNKFMYHAAYLNLNLGKTYFAQGKLEKSKKHVERGLEIAKELEVIDMEGLAYLHLSKYYEKRNDIHNAYFYYKKHKQIEDSLYNIENSKQINELATKYETEQKELEIENLEKSEALQTSKLAQQDSQLKEEEAKRQQEATLRIVLFSGIGVLLIIAGIILLGYRNKSKANKIITEQKAIVEEKNQEILDSINYAKRLQDAILPSIDSIKSVFPESFVFYQPKDIVAGDFYWSEQKENLFFIAAADCTGHGVPGAMVSVVCSNALHRVVNEYNIHDPGLILNKVRELVIATFQKSSKDVKDGMDISICCVDLKEQKMTWAGANNPLWILRSDNRGIEEIKPNKQPIGKYGDEQDFDTHFIDYQKGDAFFLFSDGYVDQFGGKKGKKFKSSNFKKLLIELKETPLYSLENILKDEFEKWRGDIEQIDDVCVIGFKI